MEEPAADRHPFFIHPNFLHLVETRPVYFEQHQVVEAARNAFRDLKSFAGLPSQEEQSPPLSDFEI